ncbi:MAG: VCBS repeat-containing protein, partial [Verrucomicrobia subdivision 3 bacterium]|nr:VCBS repeat-containing protein [Limisphaerales bacterium]
LFYAEGASFGDFNKDGKMDVVAGPFWFEGPDFKTKHELRAPTVFDPKNYSDNFLTYTADFNRDGWADVFAVPFPGGEGYWYENPGAKDGHWPRHLAYPMVGNESPIWADVTGDGQPELVFNNDGYIGYATFDTTKPNDVWSFHAISPLDKRYQRFTHGIGAGDINGDGRGDILESAGWWEQPADAATSSAAWKFHPQPFAEAASQMLVTDVDGDGLADVICSWHCHLYGLVWYRQVRSAAGEITWQQNILMPPNPDVTTSHLRCSQMHAMELVDMNGDGLNDFVTGKRFWAHGPTGDKESDAPAVLLWFELQRSGNGKVTFVPHLIDDDSGVGTQVTTGDLNGDGRPDVIVGNKKGIFVHLNEMPKH